MLTRITDQKIPCVHIHVYQIILYVKLIIEDVFPVSLTRNLAEVGKFGHALTEKKVTL